MWTRACLLAFVFTFGCIGLDGADIIDGTNSDDVTATQHSAVTNSLCVRSHSAHGRAQGLIVSALGLVNVSPIPDTAITNPDQLVTLDVPLPPIVTISPATVLSVEDTPTTGDCAASDTAIATAAQISLSLLGVTVSATALRAVASSSSTNAGASVSTAGSLVANLQINGKEIGNVTGSTVITVRLPLLGTPIAEVRVNEIILGNNTATSASVQVNALHVILLNGLNGGAEVIVGHAESAAKSQGCGCGG